MLLTAEITLQPSSVEFLNKNCHFNLIIFISVVLSFTSKVSLNGSPCQRPRYTSNPEATLLSQESKFNLSLW